MFFHLGFELAYLLGEVLELGAIPLERGGDFLGGKLG
jgi:hypothetical protein